MPLQLLSPETIVDVRDAELQGVADACEDVSYRVRQLPQGVARDIGKRHTRQQANPSTHRMEERQDTNAILDDAVDYVIVAWSGVVLPSGQAADCSRENKLQGLDAARKRALVELATSNRTAAEVRAESFRSTP